MSREQRNPAVKERTSRHPNVRSNASVLERVQAALGLHGYRRDLCEGALHERAEARGVPPETYAERLSDDALEREALRRRVLVPVTRFFRDPQAFDACRTHVFGPLLARGSTRPLRVWVAGCASGEEVVSLLITAYETASELGLPCAIQLFATDVDPLALARARRAVYPRSVADEMSSERLARFFVPCEGGFRPTRVLRSHVTFALHDVRHPPPFHRLDLVCCRNVLLYLEQSARVRVLDRFAHCVGPGGHLLLGASETTGPWASHWKQVDGVAKLYAPRADEAWSCEGGRSSAATPEERTAARTDALLCAHEVAAQGRISELLRLGLTQVLERGAHARLLLDSSLRIVAAGGLRDTGFPPVAIGQTLSSLAEAMAARGFATWVEGRMSGRSVPRTWLLEVGLSSWNVTVTPLGAAGDCPGAWVEFE